MSSRGGGGHTWLVYRYSLGAFVNYLVSFPDGSMWLVEVCHNYTNIPSLKYVCVHSVCEVVCVCVCVCVRARACVCVCECVCVYLQQSDCRPNLACDLTLFLLIYLVTILLIVYNVIVFSGHHKHANK